MDLEFTQENKKNKITITEDNNTNDVINNTPIKFDNSWMIKDVPYTEPSEEEKELLKGTKTAKELLDEEKEEQLKQKEKTNEEKEEEYKRNYIMMVKVLALYKCKFHPFSNPSEYTNENKKRVMHKMERIIKNYTEDEIKAEFNDIVNCILTDAKTDYATLPIERH